MIKTYKSCSKIPIYNYYAATFHQDCRYLIVGYDEDEDAGKYIVYKADSEFKKILTKLSEEYAVLVFDKKTMKLKKMQYAITFLVGRYNIAKKVIDIFNESKEPEVLTLLTDLNFKIDLDGDIDKQVTSIIKQFKMLKNEINLKKLKLDKLSGASDEDEKTSPEDAIRGLDKVALSLETGLELGYNLDVRKISVERWVNLLSMNNEKAERLQNI